MIALALAASLVSQSPVAESPVAESPVAETAPAPEAALAPTAAPLAPEPAPPAAPLAAPPLPEPKPDFFSEGQPGHYLQWYGAEYVAVAAVGTLVATGATDNLESAPALIGPSFSLRDPDLTLLYDPRLDDVIGRPILQEKVPTGALIVTIAAAILADAGIDLAIHRDLHRTHAVILGGAEAVLGAFVVTEGMKLGFGRLRPDFRERWTRAACAGVVERPDALSCDGVLDDGFVVDQEFLFDGMRSFPSGHASSSFATATFLAMHIGSDHLWGRHAAEWARPIAGLAVGGLIAGAGYVTATRVSDNRHHLEDVAVGAGIGIASGLGAYYLHFDTDGRARRRGVAVTPMAVPAGAGVAVTGSL